MSDAGEEAAGRVGKRTKTSQWVYRMVYRGGARKKGVIAGRRGGGKCKLHKRRDQRCKIVTQKLGETGWFCMTCHELRFEGDLNKAVLSATKESGGTNEIREAAIHKALGEGGDRGVPDLLGR